MRACNSSNSQCPRPCAAFCTLSQPGSRLQWRQRFQMPTAMVTFNGRITLPSQVRKNLGLKTGDSVDFVEMDNGRFAICPRIGSAFEIGRAACRERVEISVV